MSKRAVAIVLSAAMVVGVGACTSRQSPRDVVWSAWSRTVHAGTVRLQVAVDATQSAPGTSAQGVVDFDSGRGLFTVDGGAQAVVPAEPMTAILDREVLYTKLPAEVADRAGRPWAQFTPQDTVAVPAAAALAGFAPRRPADPLQGAAEVVRVGQERQGGEPTTHYRATLHLPRPPSAAEQLRRRLGPQLPADVWVDASGRLRRLELAVDTAGDASLAGRRVTYTFDDFGTAPPLVDVPGPDQVVKASTLPLLGAPPVGFRTTLDPRGEFVVSYPETWTRVAPSGPDSRLRLEGTGSATLTIGASAIDTKVDATTLAAGKAIIDSLPPPNPPVTTVRELPVTLNGLVGYYRLVSPSARSSAQDFAEADYFLFGDHHLFMLVFRATPGSAFAGLARTFDDIAGSFHTT